MNSDSDICEPPVKKERLDEDLEMVNFETPMQIDVPVAADAEIDPLMPVGSNQEPADGIQPSGFLQFAQLIKSEPEIKPELPVKIVSDAPEIESVMTNFVLPKSRISESFEIANSELLARSGHADFTAREIYISSDEETEEITIEPKKEEISRGSSSSVDCNFQLVDGADGSEIQQRFPQALKKQQDVTVLKTQLMAPPLAQLQPEPAVNVRPLSHASQSMPNSSSDIIGQARQTATKILNSLEQKVDYQFRLPPLSVATPSSHQDPPNWLAISESVSVDRLLKTPFSSDAWTSEQKNAIIRSSRPKPVIKISPISLQGVSAERFYNEIPWLCGSSHLKTFSCWPCLLFFYPSAPTELWSVPAALAVHDREFNQSWETHEASHVHQAAESILKIWLQSVNAPSPPNANQDRRVRNFSINERVRKNRKLLSLLVQSVCYLKKERHDAQIEDYAECFGYIVQSNSELQQTFTEFCISSSAKSPTDFVFNYATLIEEALGEFVKFKVSDEIKNARFITLFMEDLCTIVDKSTVAVISHFVDRNGDIQERILELIEIGLDRSAEEIFTHFQNVVFKFGLRLKVAGFTYSATVVHPSESILFNKRVERLCPVAKFFHYQRHNLLRMLFGAVSHLNKSCRNFFLAITEFQQFFNDHRIISSFHSFEQLNNSKIPQPKYDFDSGYITTLKRCYPSVLKTLGSILERPEDWDDGISSQAPIFMSFLREFNTRFMIVLISQLNVAIVDVSDALQGKVDTAEWKLRIRRGITNLMNIKNYGFRDIYLMALSPILVKETSVDTSDFPADLVVIFNEIIDTAVGFLHRRFNTADFGYVDLETVAQRYYDRLNIRPENTDKFRSQIQLLAKDPMIKNKTLAEALKYFYNQNLAAAVPEYATFLDFAMTIPSSNSSLHSPAVERILKYQCCRSFKPNQTKDSIWMEKELLTDIFRQKKLSEAVVDIFVTYQNTKEFSYQDVGVTEDIGVQ